MSTDAHRRPVDVQGRLSPDEFYSRYVGREPVVMRGAVAGLRAVSRWSIEYFGDIAPDAVVRLKTGNVEAGKTITMRMADYALAVADWEKRAADVDGAPAEPGWEEVERPPYLHDVPLLSIIPKLREDMAGFQANLLPPFFRDRWWDFTQFFVGPTGSETPLHFDTLLTHNLFMQISGRKRFVMVGNRDRNLCYVRDWRWSPVDPENPDLDRYPLFANVEARTAVLEAGDLLYMPPGTLHKVVSETPSMSFNIDWHDWRSALNGVAAVREGMPATNVRYNMLFALGVIGQLPAGVVLPALKSYYSYIS